MVPVALNAGSHTHGGESVVVRALVEQVLKDNMATAADIRHACNSRGCGAMVSVTGGAGWRGKIAALRDRMPMNTLPVVFELIGRNFVTRHVRAIGVAAGASLGQPQRVYGRQCVADLPNVVNAVAIDAGSDTGVTGGQALAMNTGAVLGKLVDPLLWFELMNQRGVAVATPAERGNPGAIDLSPKPSPGAHRDVGIFAGRIAAMAIDAGKAVMTVNIILEELRGAAEFGFEQRVAVQAGIGRRLRLRLQSRGAGDHQEQDDGFHPRYPSTVKTTK